MRVAAEQFVEPVDGVLDPNGNRRHQTPEVRPGGLGTTMEVMFDVHVTRAALLDELIQDVMAPRFAPRDF